MIPKTVGSTCAVMAVSDKQLIYDAPSLARTTMTPFKVVHTATKSTRRFRVKADGLVAVCNLMRMLAMYGTIPIRCVTLF